MRQHTGNISGIEREEFFLASHVVDILTKSYPGFAWSANVKTKQGVILICEPTFMDQKIPYIIHINSVVHSEKVLRKIVVDAGGEILERFFLPREAMPVSMVCDKKAGLKRDFVGLAHFDAQGITNSIGKR